MTTPFILLLAFLLDAAVGEPRVIWDRFPHPAVAMGKLIALLDARVNHGDNRKVKGVIVMAVLSMAMVLLGIALSSLSFGWLIELLCAATLLAQRSLTDHVAAVASALRISTTNARLAVARIVGRDTAQMDPPQISRAAIESAAENLSDGVVAPAFWFLLFGLPGLLLYKITNTADSMIGYRTPKHAEFGWAAAKFDDVLNFLPARLTAFIILLVGQSFDCSKTVQQDAPKHRSPNAGWPEAAMAVSLGIALSGPRSYEGKQQDFPFVNTDGRKDTNASDIDASVTMLWKVWGVCIGICAALCLF